MKWIDWFTLDFLLKDADLLMVIGVWLLAPTLGIFGPLIFYVLISSFFSEKKKLGRYSLSDLGIAVGALVVSIISIITLIGLIRNLKEVWQITVDRGAGFVAAIIFCLLVFPFAAAGAKSKKFFITTQAVRGIFVLIASLMLVFVLSGAIFTVSPTFAIFFGSCSLVSLALGLFGFVLVPAELGD